MLTGPDSAIGLAYTFDAPRDLVSHAFQVYLSCFWGIRGYYSVRQVVPLLWKDRQDRFQVTETRLSSRNPCPDQILASRVRYLLDLNVALLEVVRTREEVINHEGDLSWEMVTDYRLKEVILEHPEGLWTNIRHLMESRCHHPRQGKDATPCGLRFSLARSFCFSAVRNSILAGWCQLRRRL